jgi:hypothetical protein
MGARGFDRGEPTVLQVEAPSTSLIRWQNNNCQRSSSSSSLTRQLVQPFLVPVGLDWATKCRDASVPMPIED